MRPLFRCIGVRRVKISNLVNLRYNNIMTSSSSACRLYTVPPSGVRTHFFAQWTGHVARFRSWMHSSALCGAGGDCGRHQVDLQWSGPACSGQGLRRTPGNRHPSRRACQAANGPSPSEAPFNLPGAALWLIGVSSLHARPISGSLHSGLLRNVVKYTKN